MRSTQNIPLLSCLVGLLSLLASCGGDPNAGPDDEGNDAGLNQSDGSLPRQLLDNDFPALADVGGIRLAVPDSDSIYVLGYQNLRISAEGDIDEGFSLAGHKGEIVVDGQHRPLGLFIDPGPDEWGVLAHTLDGALDFRYEGGEAAVAQFPSPVDFGHDLYVAGAVLAPDGSSMMVAGSIASRSPSQKNRIWVARLLENGTLDPSFGDTGGYALIEPAEDELFEARAIALTPSGEIIIAGNGQVYNPLVVKLQADGSRDLAFGIDGVLETGLGTRGASSVAVDAEGRILLGTGTATGPVVARYLEDGSPDPSYGSGGVQTIPTIEGVTMQLALIEGGDLIVVGQREGQGSKTVFWTRLGPEGSPIVGLQNEAVHTREVAYMSSSIDALGRVLLIECSELGSVFCSSSRLVRLNH